jgi:uncharacterized membrane protein YkoI
VDGQRQGRPVVDAHIEEDAMGKLLNGAAAFVVGATLLGSGVVGAGAQENDGQNDANEVPVSSGTIDDGKDLQSQAGISLGQAIQAAQGAASGPVGEVDLEYVGGVLVYNVDTGTQDVKVDAGTGQVLSVDPDD